MVVAAVDRGRRVAPRAEHLSFGHEPGLDQVVEHDVGAGAGGRQIDVRGKTRRRLEQAGEHRRLGEVHVARRFAEIVLRGGVDAERAAAHIGAVEIELEDLVLRQVGLQPYRQVGLLHLALDGPLVAEKQVLGELLGDRGAALDHAAGPRIGGDGAQRAGDVDAEMLVEAPVLGGERRLDQVVGEFLERDGIVVADAARADLVAVAVEEGDGELGLLQPVVVGSLAKGRDRQRQHQDEPAGSQRPGFRQQLDGKPPPAGDVEAVHVGGEPLVELAQPGEGAENRRIEPGVEVQQQPLELRLPVLLKQVAQAKIPRISAPWGELRPRRLHPVPVRLVSGIRQP